MEKSKEDTITVITVPKPVGYEAFEPMKALQSAFTVPTNDVTTVITVPKPVGYEAIEQMKALQTAFTIPKPVGYEAFEQMKALQVEIKNYIGIHLNERQLKTIVKTLERIEKNIESVENEPYTEVKKSEFESNNKELKDEISKLQIKKTEHTQQIKQLQEQFESIIKRLDTPSVSEPEKKQSQEKCINWTGTQESLMLLIQWLIEAKHITGTKTDILETIKNTWMVKGKPITASIKTLMNSTTDNDSAKKTQKQMNEIVLKLSQK